MNTFSSSSSPDNDNKANLWGSLAAQLEMQCGDVLSLDSRSSISSPATATARGPGAPAGTGVAVGANAINNTAVAAAAEPLLRSASSVSAVAANANVASLDGVCRFGGGVNVLGVGGGHHSPPSSATSRGTGGPPISMASSNNNYNMTMTAGGWSAAAASSPPYQFQSTQFHEFLQQQQHLQTRHHQFQIHQNQSRVMAPIITIAGDQQQPSFPSFPSNHQPANNKTTNATTTSILKDWIVTNKVNREIKEATCGNNNNSSSNNNNNTRSSGNSKSSSSVTTLGKFQKEYIAKSVQVAYLLVNKLIANSHNIDQIKAEDIGEDFISIIENEHSGQVIDVVMLSLPPPGTSSSKDSNNNVGNEFQEKGNEEVQLKKLGSILGALGKLFYILFTEGDPVPSNPHHVDDGDDDLVAYNNKKKIRNETTKRRKQSREEDDIMDILLNFAMTPGDSDREDDYITSSMRRGDIPIPLCRFVSDLLYSSRIYGDGGGDNNNHDHHKGSICTSMSDVHSDLKQMIDFPDAFLYGTVQSRWEIVFGSNHVFGREKEMESLMNAVRRTISSNNVDDPTRQQKRTKEVVMISGQAGAGKSLLVQEIRKPLQAQGWIFLRCKFEKKTYFDPLSVIALGFDEYFASCAVCSTDMVNAVATMAAGQCRCSNVCCARKICEKLEGLIGLNGLIILSKLMPSLRRIMADDVHPNVNFDGEVALRIVNDARGGGDQNHTHLFVNLLDILSQLRPVLFFTDDLQWAGDASLELLRRMILSTDNSFSGSRSGGLLFVGAYRTNETSNASSLSKMLKNFKVDDVVNTTYIALRGFQLEQLNEMVSEALCLPRRKTRSLAEVVHQKTLGMPLFVVEFLDALLTEKLLVHNSATGWGWDVDSIDLKTISRGVAELLSPKLQKLPNEVLSAVKILSVLGSHVDRGVLEVVKTYDGSDGSTLIPSLYAAQREGLLDIAGPTFTFMHDAIKRDAFNLIQVTDRIPIMLRIVACLLPHCKQDEHSDFFLFTTVDIINKIGFQAISQNPGQSRAFAQLNLDAGRKAMSESNFRSALEYFNNGISFLQGEHWNNQYELSLSLHESAANANFAAGHHDQVTIHTNIVFAMARAFEDKFKSCCLHINVLAIGDTEKAMEQIYKLLKVLGEDINPNAIILPMAMVDFSSLKHMLAGARKDVLSHLPPMTDRSKLMAMKLMAMLALYYNKQNTHMSGYFSCKMIRMSIQHGHCEDTVFALAVFSVTTMRFFGDTHEASLLAKCALSLSRLYDAEKLIPRIYSRIYGAVLCFTQQMASSLPPLLKACRISFAKGTSEQSIINTMIYVVRSIQSGKKIPVLLEEVKAFAVQHKQMNQIGALQLFLAPVYKFLSNMSGTTVDPSTLLPQYANASYDDIIQTALRKKEMVCARVSVVLGLAESLYFRDFVKAYQTIIRYPTFFQMLDDKQQLKLVEFECVFLSGLISFHLAREMREPQWLQRGMNALAAFEDWAKLNAWDFQHRFHILKAELHHTQGDTNRAIESYDLAIAAAKEHHYPSHEALACELTAHFYVSIRNNEKTKEMIQKSHETYIKWGAAKKADAVIKLQLLGQSIGSNSATFRDSQQIVSFPRIGMNVQSAAL